MNPFARLGVALAFVLLSWAGASERASADDTFIHVVRPGDTLASIAQAYYGDPRRESVLVAENGLTSGGGSAIVVGMRLVVPWVRYHTVVEGETWQQLADRFYGDSRRAFVIIESNRGTSTEQPSEGAVLLIPYPLRHVATQGDHLTRVSRTYYRDSLNGVRRLRRFNGLRGSRLTRGQVVLVPLPDLLLSEEGQRLVEDRTGQPQADGEQRDEQAEIQDRIPELRELVRRGRFTEAVVLGNRLLGASVTSAQGLSIQRELGTAYVALGRSDMAERAFREALRYQPDLELDGLRTSPTVMRSFRRAREALRAEAAAAEAAAPDAGVSEDAGVTP